MFSPRLPLWKIMPALLVVVSLGLPGLRAEQAAEVVEKPQYTLRYHFKTGQAVGYQIKSMDRSTIQRDEITETSQNLNACLNHMDVIEVRDDGTAVLEIQIDRALMETKFDEHPAIVFDSTDETKQPSQFWEIKQSIGKPTSRAVVTTSGELISIQNLRPDPRDPKRPPGPPKKDAGQNFLVKLPEDPVSVGSRWQEDYEIMVAAAGGPAIPVKMRRTFTLEAVEGQLARISMKTVPLTPINNPQMEARMIQQTPSCQIEFDIAAGRINKRNWKVEKVVVGGFGPNTSYKVVWLRSDTLQASGLQTVSQE